MKLEAAEDHTPCNVNTREKQLDPRQEEKNQEKSLQTEVNVTRAKIRNRIGFKEKKKSQSNQLYHNMYKEFCQEGKLNFSVFIF